MAVIPGKSSSLEGSISTTCRFKKKYHNSHLDGASCKLHFCIIFCFLHELHVHFMQIYVKLMHYAFRSCETEKRYCRSWVYMKQRPNEKLKNRCIMVFSASADFIDCYKDYLVQRNPEKKRGMRTSHKTPLKSTTNTREASLRTRRSTTRIKQTMRIIMREPREERTLRTIINLPQNQGIKTSTTMGVSRCCENRCWFALVFWCAYCSLF